VSVVVSVGLSVPSVNVLGHAAEETHGRSVNTGCFHDAAFRCLALQSSLVRIRSPLLYPVELRGLQ